MTLSNIKNFKKLREERGFTIVELLIVIIVIGILATLVLIAYNNVQGQARDTKRNSDASSLRDAAAAFKSQSSVGAYPSTAGGTGNGTFAGDIAGMSPATITLDPSVTGKINSAGPSSGNPDYIAVTYCPSSATSGTATGMLFTYWQESKTQTVGGTATHVYSVSTGSGC